MYEDIIQSVHEIASLLRQSLSNCSAFVSSSANDRQC